MERRTVQIADIIRPHQSILDQAKLEYLVESIKDIGLQEPIDLLEFDGKLYGFNGCHRYNAHKRLGLQTIEAKVRTVDKATFRLHLM
ncbi:sulfiredoxin [Synechococcus sp. UW140]|uniref:sulfiredoxin n=1 Tax=Synechococcus sp. UW140 TaxID=368503 RepID=UPI000E0FD5CB|nr:sulfiredoxin [Synechococcus sp. UW140]